VEVQVIRFSFGGRLGFCLGQCPLRSYRWWASVSLAFWCRLHDHASSYPVASFISLVYMIMHHRIPWQCRLHDHASSYSVASIHPTSVHSPSRSCAFPFYQLDSNHDGPIPPLLRIRSRWCRRVASFTEHSHSSRLLLLNGAKVSGVWYIDSMGSLRSGYGPSVLMNDVGKPFALLLTSQHAKVDLKPLIVSVIPIYSLSDIINLFCFLFFILINKLITFSAS